VKARSRLPRSTLKGRTPREFPAVAALNPLVSVRSPRQGETQEPRPAGPARSFGDGNNGRRNGRWVHPAGNVWVPGGRSSFEGANPRSAVDLKNSRLGIEGSKPSRGQPNPEGGT
jgi:hypothetical protein